MFVLIDAVDAVYLCYKFLCRQYRISYNTGWIQLETDGQFVRNGCTVLTKLTMISSVIAIWFHDEEIINMCQKAHWNDAKTSWIDYKSWTKEDI